MGKSNIKTVFKKITYTFIVALISLCSLELCFRYQIFDFYKSELYGLNPDLEQNPKNEVVLIIGDSFSAHPDGYVKHLRNSFPKYNFINSSIPGTGIKQHELIIQNRIMQFKPKHVIYQFYVGNDFTDLKHPVNFKELTISRNIFWLLSENFLVLKYINLKLGSFTAPNQPAIKLRNELFSIKNYHQRVKTYFKGDRNHLDNTIQMKGEQQEIYQQWKKRFINMSQSIPDSVPVTLLLIPSCAQVSSIYKDQMEQIGATLSENTLNINYLLHSKMKQDFSNITILNPLETFQLLEQKGKKLYYNNNPHLNLEGQKYLGDYLIKNLKIRNE
jgi:hypothetical protein